MERSDEAAYDNTARILGRGTASVGGAYILPYLQSGHMLLLGVLLLASTISYPGDHMHAHAYMHMHMHTHAYMHTCMLLRSGTLQRDGRFSPSRKCPTLQALTWQASP